MSRVTSDSGTFPALKSGRCPCSRIRGSVEAVQCAALDYEDGQTVPEVSGEGLRVNRGFCPSETSSRALPPAASEAASGSKGLCLHFQEAQPSEFSEEPCSGLADGLCPPRCTDLLRCLPRPMWQRGGLGPSADIGRGTQQE